MNNIPEARLGLFTGNKPISKNEVIVPYTGTASPTVTNGPYVLKVNKNHFINANRYIDTAGFANECRKENKKNNQCSGNNSRFAVNQRKKEAVIRATKTIPAQAEVFVPYGVQYWRQFDKSLLTSKAKQKTG